jgi:hypothetical protein
MLIITATKKRKKTQKNAIKFLCELCLVNTSCKNILIYIWQLINTKINNNQHKNSNYQQMDSIKNEKKRTNIIL